jgi:ATP-dependent Clp protease ATP-binding subunit ClpA
MFDRFTENARRTMSNARQEAQRLQHDYIGTEHVLLGVLAQNECVGARLLTALGVDLGRARQAVDATVRTGTRPVTHAQLPFTPRAKQVLERSLEEAQRLHDDFIGTEHLVLGLLRVDGGVASDVLLGCGATLAQARTQVTFRRELPQATAAGDARPAPPPTRDERMRAVVRAAREQACALGQRAVGTEHLLLALAGVEGSAEVELRAVGATPEALRDAVVKLRRPGDAPIAAQAWSFTPRATAALERSEGETAATPGRPFGPEHLLLAVLSVRDGLAVTALTSLGIDPDALRASLLRRLGGN